MINISIDLSKLDKSRIKEGKNGAKYYNLTVDKKQQPDQFGNDHTVYQTPTKEEREARAAKVYVGSGKEFIFNNQQQSAPVQQQQGNNAGGAAPTTIDDLPFRWKPINLNLIN